MTTAIKQYFVQSQLTPVRLLQATNLSATYYNGASNNGVGATLTTASATLTMDSVACVNGDRIALIGQTNTYENGIYVVSGVGTAVILTRSYDFQTFDQMVPGFFITVAAGTVYGGAMFGLIEPQPSVVGTSAITFTDASSSPTSVTLVNSGLRVLDTNGSHYLQITPGSDLTANRIFTLVTGDAARTLTLGANVSLNQDLQTTDSPTFAGVTLGNTGLHILDTNASHDLIIAPGSDLTADRTLTVTTGDAARTLTLSGNPTLSDWFDQSVKAADSPAFAGVTLNNTGLHLLDTNASHDLIVAPGSDLTADRTLTVTTGDADRTLDISAASVTVSAFGASLVDDAAASNARTTLQIFAGTTADIGGGGAGPISVAVAGMTAATSVVATIESSTNTVAVAKCTGTATGFDITFSADPGAACLVNYAGFGA